jgi:hypothetical protein
MFNSHKILVNHYTNQIKADFNWDKIKSEAVTNCRVEEDMIIASCYLGTVFGITPSGKVYAFWTSNQTRSDVRRDEAFNEALEKVAEENDLFIEYFDDSIFACRVVEFTEAKCFVTSDDAEKAEALQE